MRITIPRPSEKAATKKLGAAAAFYSLARSEVLDVARSADVPDMSHLRLDMVYLLATALRILLDGGFRFTGPYAEAPFLLKFTSQAMQIVSVCKSEDNVQRKAYVRFPATRSPQ